MNTQKRNSFKLALKENTPLIKNINLNNPEQFKLLKNLDLLNASNNVKIWLSEDKKYINFQLKDPSIKKPLIFQLPIEDENLEAYYTHPLFEELSNRYELYSTEYKDKIKEYSIKERQFLQERFPGLVFNLKIRMKSKSSYEKKINGAIKNNAEIFINDIIAERIIISEYNGSRDPEVLKQACYDVREALCEFRRTTDFKLKHSKDYIAIPKTNGYQSLHDSVLDSTNPDCCFETQIRTFDMEEKSKKDEAIAHTKYKPRLLNDLSTLKVPKYAEVTSFTDSAGLPILLDIPTSHAFYHFYGISIVEFRQQLLELEKYVSLKEIRLKLKQLNKNKNKEKTIEE